MILMPGSRELHHETSSTDLCSADVALGVFRDFYR
jgi:hypothetical protein